MTAPNLNDPGMPPPEFFEEMAKDCRCCVECHHQVPCDTVCAGGVCLGFCTCAEDEDRRAEEERDDDFDRNGCPGCGGNCQVACR